MSGPCRGTRRCPSGEPPARPSAPDHAYHRSRRPPAPRGGATPGELAPTLGRVDTAVTDPLVGLVLEGRYRLEERVARGGMSMVYAATDLRLHKTVAVKVMAEHLAHDPTFVDRFTREARA